VKAAAVKAAAVKAAAVKAAAVKAAAVKAAAAKAAAVKAAAAKAAAAKAAAAKAAAIKAARPLVGWLGNGTTFPARALVLFAPSGDTLSAGHVHVTENGSPVTSLTLTPLTQANARDFGVVLVIDQSPSMRGAPLAEAMTAARALAAQRSAKQELGLVTFDALPNVILPLTSVPLTIGQQLAVTPWTGDGADVPSALTLAFKQLSEAKVASGGVILISDGVGVQAGSGGPTTQSVAALARAAHVPIFTLGLADSSSTPASMRQLAQVAGGNFAQTSAATLSREVTKIAAGLTRGYVVRYRSRQPAGHQIAVAAQADGVHGTVNASYVAPAPAPALAPPPAAPRPVTPSVSRSGLLSALPAFDHGSPIAAPAQSQSFWASSLGMLAVSVLCALLIVCAVAMAFRRPSKRAVQARVGSFIPGALDQENGAGQQTPATGSGLLRLLERRGWWAPFVENVQVARGPHSPLQLVQRAAAAGAIVAVLATLLSGTVLVGLVALLAWPFVLRAVMNRRARKQRDLFRDQLPSHLQDLSGAMRSGRSVVGAISAVAESADEPIRSELERAVTDEQLGRPLEESLDAVARRMQAEDMEQVSLIAALHRRSGSNVAEAFDRVAEGARDRADLRREIKALTGQAKLSSLVLTGLPPLLLVAMHFVDPAYEHPLFHTTGGIVLLVVATGMVLGGWRVMQKIINVKA